MTATTLTPDAKPELTRDQKLAITFACPAACAASHVGCLIAMGSNTALTMLGGATTSSLAISALISTVTSTALYAGWHAWWTKTQKQQIDNTDSLHDIPRHTAWFMGGTTLASVGFMALPVSYAAGAAALGTGVVAAAILKSAPATPFRATAKKLGITFAIAAGALAANITSHVPLTTLRSAYEMTNVPGMKITDKLRLANDYIDAQCRQTPQNLEATP